MAREGMGEALSLLTTLSVAIAGINIVWGIFLYPWGLLGFAFAAVDIGLFFLSLKIKDLYEERNYEEALSLLKIMVILGFICGLVIIGAFAYPRYRELDDIVSKKYLIKSAPGQIYSPPQFPKK
ncbi:MAG: hypothetical protein GXO25_05860 [Euryarchaeota archaeon]|nr:hypothetical protein [Euryarchaeota archaeon]